MPVSAIIKIHPMGVYSHWVIFLLETFWKTILLYIVLVVTVRLMGKRQIGQLEPAEFVVAMALADLATLPMQGMAMHTGIIPMVAILLLEKSSAFLSMRFISFRKLLCGKPVILMENGKIIQSNMRKTKVTIDELTGHLREKDVLDLSTVRYAILETNGNISVFLQQDGAMPVTIVSDGKILQDNLKKSGRDLKWLQKTLSAHGAEVKNTWLLTVDDDGKEQFYKKDKP